MCSKSDLNAVLPPAGAGAGAAAPSIGGPSSGSFVGERTVSVTKVLQNRADYYIIDIRGEADEEKAAEESLGSFSIDLRIPLGLLLRTSREGKFDHLRDRKIATICNIGYRSGLAARELASIGFNAVSIDRGLIAVQNKVAVRPDFVVLIATTNQEKATIAVSAAAAAQADGKQTALVFMAEGVVFLRKPGVEYAPQPDVPRLEEVNIGAPFSSCATALSKFLANGGVVIGCTSCCVHRGWNFNDHILECVNKMQMPDLVRMLTSEAKGSLQFT